jgi:hypothetical protein
MRWSFVLFPRRRASLAAFGAFKRGIKCFTTGRFIYPAVARSPNSSRAETVWNAAKFASVTVRLGI